MNAGGRSEHELELESELETERQLRKQRETRISELEDERHRLRAAQEAPPRGPAKGPKAKASSYPVSFFDFEAMEEEE